MPADRCGIKENICPLQSRQARTLGIPLVPADQRAQTSGAGVEGTESEVAWGEVEFLVIEGIVGDVHLAVETAQGAVFVKDRSGIVIDAGSTFFEERRDQHYTVVASRGGQFFSARTRNGLGKIEQGMIFALAEVLRLKKFGQTDDLGSALGGVRDTAKGLVEILFWLWAAGHLDQGHAEFFWRQRSDLRDQYSIRPEELASLR
jgi:hypothetical protein